MYRTRGRNRTSRHNSTPSATGVKGTRGTTGTRPRRPRAAAGPAWVGRATASQTSHAIPPQHEPTQAQKPQNINDQISIPEILSRELHTKLMIEHHNRATYNNPKHSQAPRRGTEQSEALASRAARPDSAQNNSGDTRTQARRPTHRAKLG